MRLIDFIGVAPEFEEWLGTSRARVSFKPKRLSISTGPEVGDSLWILFLKLICKGFEVALKGHDFSRAGASPNRLGFSRCGCFSLNAETGPTSNQSNCSPFQEI
jgi:hypothetical protein